MPAGLRVLRRCLRAVRLWRRVVLRRRDLCDLPRRLRRVWRLRLRLQDRRRVLQRHFRLRVPNRVQQVLGIRQQVPCFRMRRWRLRWRDRRDVSNRLQAVEVHLTP